MSRRSVVESTQKGAVPCKGPLTKEGRSSEDLDRVVTDMTLAVFNGPSVVVIKKYGRCAEVRKRKGKEKGLVCEMHKATA